MRRAFQDFVCSLVSSDQSAHAFDCIARHVVLLDSGRWGVASGCRSDRPRGIGRRSVDKVGFGATFLDQSLQIESVLFRGEERREKGLERLRIVGKSNGGRGACLNWIGNHSKPSRQIKECGGCRRKGGQGRESVRFVGNRNDERSGGRQERGVGGAARAKNLRRACAVHGEVTGGSSGGGWRAGEKAGRSGLGDDVAESRGGIQLEGVYNADDCGASAGDESTGGTHVA